MFMRGNGHHNSSRRSQKKALPKAISQKEFANRFLVIADNAFFFAFSAAVLRIIFLNILAASPLTYVGDMLDFHANSSAAWDQGIAVPARRVAGPWAAPGITCELDEPTMAKSGGELTVMAIRPDGIMLSWAGGPTAPGQADCTNGAQMLVTTSSYIKLSSAEAPDPMR
jgi:hypothetical protein